MEIAPLQLRIRTVYGFRPINTSLAFRDRTIVEIEDVAISIGIHCVERLQLETRCCSIPLVEIRSARLCKRLNHARTVIKARHFYCKKMRLVLLLGYRTMMTLAQLIVPRLSLTLHNKLYLPRLCTLPTVTVTIQIRIGWMIKGQSIHVRDIGFVNRIGPT